MKVAAPDCWTDYTSVLFTSFWGWTPEHWGTVGWSGDRGHARRANLLKELSDPFITVCYVTSNKTFTDPDLKGMIGGFYLVSHETGDRDEFTHPIHHDREPDKWRHSLRAIRAFSYLPEYRLSVSELDPSFMDRARSISAMGTIITDRAQIERLRTTPWVEVEVFSSGTKEAGPVSSDDIGPGMVPAGPASDAGYMVPDGTQHLPRELYVLRLKGDVEGFLGRAANGASIFKIGLSVSPDLRRQTLQKSMPRGVYRWQVDRSTRRDGHAPYSGHRAAVAGEDAMKHHLARNAEWLGGEFYLATEANIEAAWLAGREAALSLEQA